MCIQPCLKTLSQCQNFRHELIVGRCKQLLVRRKLRCLVHLCPTGKKMSSMPGSVSLKTVLLKRDFAFQYIPQKCWQRKLLSCASIAVLRVRRWCFLLNWKEFSLLINLSIPAGNVYRNRRVVVVEIFICSANYFNTLLLWYI